MIKSYASSTEDVLKSNFTLSGFRELIIVNKATPYRKWCSVVFVKETA